MTSNPGPILRNAVWLIGAQIIAAPLSVLINAVAGRYFGPGVFGTFYLITTYAGFALLFVEWGQFGALTGKIAAQRSRAGELLGSAIIWRIAAAVVVSAVVLVACAVTGYGRSFLVLISLMLAIASFGTVAGACQDAVRGFERTDFAALTSVGVQITSAAVSIALMVRGFGLRGLLLGQLVCAAIATGIILSLLPRVQIPRLQVRRKVVAELFQDGRPFLTFVLIVQLQPLVDGAMMSHFASADAIGWYAAARKLVGILIFPAATVGSVLFPTLVRQFVGDLEGFRATVRGALRVLYLVVLPLALGSVLFPQLGVQIFNARTFAPAEQNVRLLAAWLLLLYFSIPLSQCINATGRQGRWAAVQFGCVVISALADPFLIRWFQQHHGNGGLGVCVASIASEILMLVGATLLIPKGILDRSMLR
ncbi:MAG TPA: oligosaccharide flippase family protein, partial [Steroidobacteraceae bacterium]|nr:oligosaccharide flippase family protein [Steroidobacteraceae bacterium]